MAKLVTLKPERDPDDAEVRLLGVWFDDSAGMADSRRVEMSISYGDAHASVWMNEDDVSGLIQALLEVTEVET